MGGYLTKEAILKSDDLPREEVHVPEWADPETGGDLVLVQGMNGTQRDEWEASMAVMRGGQLVPDLANARAKLAARCIIGEDGEPLFTQADAAALGRKSSAALDRVAKAATRLSGMDEGGLEEMAGNSPAALSGASTSSSPETSSTAP